MTRSSCISCAGTLALALMIGPLSGCGGGSTSVNEPAAFRSITAANRFGGGGYKNVESQVIHSQSELDSFIAAVFTDYAAYTYPKPEYDPDVPFDPFITNIRAANLDFSREALLVIKQRQDSGLVAVSLDPPVVQNQTFVSTVRIKNGTGGIPESTDQVYAFVLSKAQVKSVRIPVISTYDSEPKILRTISLTVEN